MEAIKRSTYVTVGAFDLAAEKIAEIPAIAKFRDNAAKLRDQSMIERAREIEPRLRKQGEELQKRGEKVFERAEKRRADFRKQVTTLQTDARKQFEAFRADPRKQIGEFRTRVEEAFTPSATDTQAKPASTKKSTKQTATTAAKS